jgi:hypothetical protein
MRIGGDFPLNPAHAFPVSLVGGESCYIPPGNYLVTLGGQTVLQWWDPVQYSWRDYGLPGYNTMPVHSDGYNWRLFNASGVVAGASITTPGTGGTNGIGPAQTGTTVAFAASNSTGGITAAGYAIVGGAVGTVGGALTITNAGSGFLEPPQLLLDPPPIGGVQATAIAVLSATGTIASATMVNPGAGYTSVPNVYVVPQFQTYPGAPGTPGVIPVPPTPVQPNFPPGQIALLPPQGWSTGLTPAFPTTGGALLTAPALAGSGTLTGIVMTNNGTGYTSVPAITFANTFGTLAGGVAATSLMSWALLTLTGASGAGVTIGNPWISSMGYLTPGPTGTRFYNNNFMFPRVARGVATSTAGALSIEDNGFGFQVVLIPGNFGFVLGTTDQTTAAVFSAITMGGLTDTCILQMVINE